MNEFDFEAIRHIAEQLDPTDVGQTEDYMDEFVIPIGTYTSHQREIARTQEGNPDVRRKDDGTAVVVLSLTGGIQNPDTGEFFANGAFPLKAYLSSKKYEIPGRPGKTSGLAQYLSKFGFEVGGKTTADLLGMIPQTLDLPIGVDIAWTDRGQKQPDGSYKNANLKNGDFNRGSKQEPSYHPVVVKDGVTYKASAKVNGWRKLKTQ